MKTIFPEKKWYANSWKLLFLTGLIGFFSISCSADAPSYNKRPGSRSFTGDRFHQDEMQYEGVFRVVDPEYPTCSFMLEFLSEEQIKTPNRTYQYVIDEAGKIHMTDPADSTSVLVTIEVRPQNAENSEYISVTHNFTDREAAEESGMWPGALPPGGPYRYDADWYRARVVVGLQPYDIVLVPSAKEDDPEEKDYLYVTNAFQNTVSVISLPENTVVKTITVGRNPKRLAVSPDGSHVYVVNTEEGDYGTVSVLRTADHTNIKTIPVGIRPYGVTVSPDGNYVYVTNTSENSIRVIQTSDHTVLATMPLGQDTLEYVEVYFGDLFDGLDYSIVIIEGECGALSQVPDLTNPICREDPYNVECPMKCPSAVGRIRAVFREVRPDENGYWFSGFLTDKLGNGSISIMIVEDFTGAEGMDLDQDDNGVLDYEESEEAAIPWGSIVDEIGVDHVTGSGKIYSQVVLRAPSSYGPDYLTGGYSRIPNGIDTDSADDWTRNLSSWLHPVYADDDVFHLIDIPVTGKAYNSPGEANQLYDGAGLPEEQIKADHPVVNEFLMNRGEYRPIALLSPWEAQEDEDHYFYLSTQENIILKIYFSKDDLYAVVEKINLGSGGANISNTTDMTLLPEGDLYVVDKKKSSVAVIREGALIERIPVGFTPFGIASSSDGRYVFVTSLVTKLLTVIRTSDNSITELIPLRDDSTGVAAPRDGNYVYVTNGNQSTVSVVLYSDDTACN